MKYKILSNIIILISSGILQAQWQPDVRLTNDSEGSYTSLNNARCIATNGDAVHIVWFDSRSGNHEIYYKRSTDAGISWGEDIRLTYNPAVSWTPSISVSGQFIHVAWTDERDGNFEIYYKRSTNGGTTWETDTRLTNDLSTSWSLCLGVYGDDIHVVWEDDRDGNFEIYYKHSTDAGVSWDADTRLTNNSADSYLPSISVAGNVVHVIWEDYRNGPFQEIYYKRSTNAGISWGVDTRLTNDSADSYSPSLSVSGQTLHVVWCDGLDPNSGIYYKRSTDAGLSWTIDTRITNDSAVSASPVITVSGQIIHVIWVDSRNDNFNLELYYKRSTDGGLLWEADTRLTNASFDSKYPSIAVSGTVVHVLWTDERDSNNNEIYYKRNPTGNPIGIMNFGNEIPAEYYLSQNYPNPFNPVTKLRFEISELRFVKLVIYDILGKEVITLVNERLSLGIYEVNWNANNFPSGVYFYTLTAHEVSGSSTGDFTETKKMVLIK